LARKYARIFVRRHYSICSEKRTVIRERSLRNTVCFEEQIMSKDKYPNIFSKSNGGYGPYYTSNIFATPVICQSAICQSHQWFQNHNFFLVTSRLSNGLRFSGKNMLSEKVQYYREGKTRLFNSLKDKIQVANSITSRTRSSLAEKCVNHHEQNSRRFEVLILSSRVAVPYTVEIPL